MQEDGSVTFQSPQSATERDFGRILPPESYFLHSFTLRDCWQAAPKSCTECRLPPCENGASASLPSALHQGTAVKQQPPSLTSKSSLASKGKPLAPTANGLDTPKGVRTDMKGFLKKGTILPRPAKLEIPSKVAPSGSVRSLPADIYKEE